MRVLRTSSKVLLPGSATVIFLLLLFPRSSSGQLPASNTVPNLEGLPVRSITIHGLEKMDGDVVRRRLELSVGSPYSSDTARRDERAITGLMTFWSVRIQVSGYPDRSRPQSVEVAIHIDERFAWFAAPQINWSPEEGWSYGFDLAYLNVARRGHQLFFSLLTGGARYLKVSFQNPWNGSNHQSFDFEGTAVHIRNNLYNFNESGERFNLEMGRWYGRNGRGIAGISYRRVVGANPAYSSTPGARFHDRLHSIWLYLGRNSTDPWGYPRIGTITGIRIERYGGFLGGNISGSALRATVINRRIIKGDWVSAGMMTLDGMWGEQPFWKLLTLGGANSVRGYPLGHYLVTRRWEVSGELQWYVVPMHVISLGKLGDQIVGVSLAVFLDAGGGNGIRRGPGESPWPDRTPTLISTGVGCYFHNALLGMIRIEVAWPEDGPRHSIFGLGIKF